MKRSFKFIALGLVLAATPVRAADLASSLHPAVVLVDGEGTLVIKSGRPVSTMRTCGKCHDSPYIAAHSYHVALGSDERTPVGAAAEQRAWDYGPGSFGRWNPIDLSLPDSTRRPPFGFGRGGMGPAAGLASRRRRSGGVRASQR